MKKAARVKLGGLGLTALVAFVSCFPGAKAPDVTPTRTLSLEEEAKTKTAKTPFGVVFGGPHGKIQDASEVSIVWNRPMRALEIAGEESSAPATIASADGQTPKGNWRWMGTSAAVFIPEKALPRATEYTVTVPAGTKSLDGSVMGAKYDFQFETPRPKLVRSEPGEGASHLLPGNTFDLRFNQPVDPKEVDRALSLLVTTEGSKEAKKVAFAVSQPKGDTPMLVRLTPRAPLPLNSDIAIHIDASFHGTEGPLPIEPVTDWHMRTYGPLTTAGVECYASTPDKKCAARGSFSLSFSNRVEMGDVPSHVQIDPPVRVDWPKLESKTNKTSWVGLAAHFRPASSYRVTITRGLKDEYGQVLAKDATFTVTTGDEWPNVQIGLSGQIFEANAPKPVPLASINTPTYEMIASELDEAGIATLVSSGYDYNHSEWDRATSLRGIKVQTVKPNAGKNAFEVKRVEVDKLLKNGRGAAVLGVRFTRGDRNPSDVRVINVTDLGITAKESRFGSILWVTHLSDGKPVSGAHVELRSKDNNVEFTGTTDANGLVNIPRGSYSPGTNAWESGDDTIAFVRTADDFAFAKMSDRLDSWRFNVPVEMNGATTPVGMTFTDRGIYKLGETIHAKSIFRMREPKGTSSLKGEKVTLTAQDSNGTQFWTEEKTLGDFGEVSADIPIPNDARLGDFGIRAHISGKKNAIGDSTEGSAFTSVQVAAYKPAEFKVGVDPDKTSYIHGDKANFAVRGDYLFGAPMGGSHLRYTVTRSATSFTPPNTEGFSTDDNAWSWAMQDRAPRGGPSQSGQGDLDGKGTFNASVALGTLGGNPTTNPELLSIEAEVEDVSRQTIAGRTSVIVHPASVYVALKNSDDFFIEKNKPVSFSAIAVTPDGKRRAGETIHAELLRRSWKTVTEANDEDTGHYISKAVDERVAQCDVKSGNEPVSCELKTDDAGYFIVRATIKDARGNSSAASTSVYALGSGEMISWGITDGSALELVTDKKSYEPGQTAKILIKNPYTEAHAIISVERAGVYKTWEADVTGPMPTVDVLVTEDLRPNAFVSVELLRGRSGKTIGTHGPDLGRPQFREGYTEILVNPQARRLKVEVLPAKKNFGPGEQVEADLKVTDRAGKGVKTDVTFYAVDEGVLMLTGYTTPDPLPTFMQNRPLAVLNLESRNSLAHILKVGGFLGDDKGGDGGGGGATTSREDFRSTAAFLPDVRTGADGKAHVSFKLPDSLTTYRLMAVAAAEDDRFGFGDSQVVTSRPLMARPALPRFLRTGDTIDAGIVISTKNLPAGNVDVELKAEGVDVMGDLKKSVAVPANGNVEVRFSMKSPNPTKMKLRFSASGMGAKDDVTVTRDVLLPLVPEAVALYGDTKENAGEELGNLAGVRPDFGGLEIKLSSSALVGLDDGLKSLIEYPYGCAEQLTSRIVPLVALSSIAKDYDIKLPEDLKPVIEKAIAKVLLDQQEGGGFGYWPDSREPSVWLSAYVLWGLSLAEKAGYHVPDQVIARTTAFVRSNLASMNRDYVSRATAAFTLDVLATVGEPDAGYMSKLYDEREKMPLFARGWLAHAIAVSAANEKGDTKAVWQAQTKELLRDLEAHLRVSAVGATVVENVGDEYAVMLDSEARTTAIALRALVAIDKDHPLAPRIGKGLLAMRKGGTWRSTQETAWSLVSLGEYAKAVESESPDFKARVFFAGKEAFEATFAGKSVKSEGTNIPMQKLFEPGTAGSVLAFDKDGSGRLFYEARLRYARTEMPKDGIDRGFFVKKFVRSLKPEALYDAMGTLPQTSATSAQAGDLVLVDLIVVTPDPREQVVIDDPLPAGLEPVQTNLQTTAKSLDVAEFGGAGDSADDDHRDDDSVANGSAYGYAWYHREFDDDKVLTFVDHMPAGMFHYRYLARATTIGSFVTPPAKVECMYEPETFGRTGGVTFEVKSK